LVAKFLCLLAKQLRCAKLLFASQNLRHFQILFVAKYLLEPLPEFY
jgi:hypothetical protein